MTNQLGLYTIIAALFACCAGCSTLKGLVTPSVTDTLSGDACKQASASINAQERAQACSGLAACKSAFACP